MPTSIETRLTADDLIARYESRAERVRSALFWLCIGAMAGAAAVEILQELLKGAL